MEQTRYRYVIAAALAASAACVNPLAPQSARLKDPGTLVVSVQDEGHQPLTGVWVYVELPNDVGSVFWEGTATGGDGKTTFHYVPAGTRMVEVKPSPGYSAVGPVKQEVQVLKGKTAATQFTLRRN